MAKNRWAYRVELANEIMDAADKGALGRPVGQTYEEKNIDSIKVEGKEEDMPKYNQFSCEGNPYRKPLVELPEEPVMDTDTGPVKISDLRALKGKTDE